MPRGLLFIDRLFETCHARRASDILVAPNSQPLIRFVNAWRTIESKVVQQADIDHICKELLEPASTKHASGYAYVDVNFGDTAKFRVMAFGFPSTAFLIIARFPEANELEPGTARPV